MMGENYFLIDSTGNATEIDGELKIGRNKTNGLVLSDPLASRHHATVYMEDEVLMIRDEESVNGTFVNNEQIYDPTPLKDQDRIQFGDEVFIVRAPLAESKTIMASDEEGAEKEGSGEKPVPEAEQETVMVDQEVSGKLSEKDKAEVVNEGGTDVKDQPKSDSRRIILIIAVSVIFLCVCCVVMVALWFFVIQTTSSVIESGFFPLTTEMVPAFLAGL